MDSDLEAAAAAADVVVDDDAILPEPLTTPRVAALAMAERRRNMAVGGVEVSCRPLTIFDICYTRYNIT